MSRKFAAQQRLHAQTVALVIEQANFARADRVNRVKLDGCCRAD
jgi:hypothetical protein